MEEIFSSDKVLQFWPTDKQSPKERVYATTRFILYLACILYIIRRDVRILIVAALALGALYYMYKNGMIRETEYMYAQKPSDENVMNNGIDGTGPPDRNSLKKAWDEIHPYMESRWFAEHNFYTVPSNDNQRFVENAYSNLMMPVCRDNPEFCDPDSSMARGVEFVQRSNLMGGGQKSKA
jgi:hypothetical protein